ncbi:hypothetical protein M0R45_018206 [Rubus argutus]|uniref:DUF4005 domain-containing protein n=1 Tax=Rubus argutus TaxID=59490 RepID=A0AAW1X589_RUBAR
MGKTGKWLRSFLTGKKDNKDHKDKVKCTTTTTTTNESCSPATTHDQNPTTPISTPKEKKRWSFRRSSATSPASKDSNSVDAIPTTPPPVHTTLDISENYEQKKHALAVAAATAAVADATAAAAQAAAAVIRLTAAVNGKATATEEAAAIKIQSFFRSYLARKALCALKGLVKLQALVRGHLVRKQAKATLRCMQALVTAQARARAQRIRMVEDGNTVNPRPSTGRRSLQDNRLRHAYNEIDRGMEENIKIVEMDLGEPKGNVKSRNSYSNHAQTDRPDSRFSTQSAPNHQPYSKPDNYSNVSPAPSALTQDMMSPGACSAHFEDFSFGTAQSSPQCYSAMSRPDPSRVPFAFPRPDYAEQLSYDYQLYPNYMANTQSSKAKARSQSAPKQRPPDAFERQPSRPRRTSMEGRNHIPRAVKMQRSSSHVGSTAQNYQYPWYNIKLDRSSVSLMESECGSSSTVLTTNTNYCKSLVAFDGHGSRY